MSRRTLTVDDDLHDYVIEHGVREHPELAALRRQEFFQRKAISRPINVFLGHFVAVKKNLILKPCIACSRQLVPVSKTFRV